MTCSLLFYMRYDSFRLSSTVPLLAGRLAKLYVIVICLILLLGHLDEMVGDPAVLDTDRIASLNAWMVMVVGLLETAHDWWIAKAFDRAYFRYRTEASVYKVAAYLNLALFLGAVVLTVLAELGRCTASSWLQNMVGAHAFFFFGLGITALDIVVLVWVRVWLRWLQQKGDDV